MSFLDKLDEAVKEGKQNKLKREKDPKFTLARKVSLLEKIKGAKGAFQRYRQKSKEEGKESVWVDEKEVTERIVCCSTCTDGGSCPYCGCQIKKSWFLPLGKSELSTEGCPNPTSYPHLHRFPPKNYWQVCNETTSVIIPARNEWHLEKTVQNLLDTATGKIEILVGFDGPFEISERTNIDYSLLIKDKRVKLIWKEKSVGRRAICNELVKQSTGKFICKIDAHCKLDFGWDTKLKCICEDNNLVTCAFDELDINTFERKGNKWVGNYIDKDLNLNWYPNNYFENDDSKVYNVMSFFPSLYMITRNTFDKFGGHQLYLGEHIHEDLEWTFNIKCTGGDILLRRDVICAHWFKDEYNYDLYDNDLVNKGVLKSRWNSKSKMIVNPLDQLLNEMSNFRR